MLGNLARSLRVSILPNTTQGAKIQIQTGKDPVFMEVNLMGRQACSLTRPTLQYNQRAFRVSIPQLTQMTQHQEMLRRGLRDR